MAQRAWLVRPDHEIDIVDPVNGYAADGAVGAVSQNALAKAVLDGVVMLDRAGGVLSVTVARAPTGVPGERVTTGALIEWKDRTDARPQPESDGPPLRAQDPLPAVATPNGPMQVSVTAEQEMPAVDERDVPPELRGT
jgi:hypothetical protein